VRARRIVFAAGLALVVVALVPPLHDLSFDALTMHLLQNVMLAEWAPALLVFGLAPETGRRLAELVPYWVGLPVWLLTYYVWHAPPLYDAALRSPTPLLHLEHASYLLAGVAFWLPVAHGRLEDGPKAAYVFAAFVFAAPLGLLLALLPSPAYDFYDGHWGLTALADQQIAGVTMASEEAVVFFAVFAFYVRRFMREQS
jgi:putative membrane protein